MSATIWNHKMACYIVERRMLRDSLRIHYGTLFLRWSTRCTRCFKFLKFEDRGDQKSGKGWLMTCSSVMWLFKTSITQRLMCGRAHAKELCVKVTGILANLVQVYFTHKLWLFLTIGSLKTICIIARLSNMKMDL